MVGAVSPGPEFRVGSPTVLFEADVWKVGGSAATAYDVAPDGQRVIAILPETRETAPLEIAVIPDFVEEMKARLASGSARR
jgi:hypothetical protein